MSLREQYPLLYCFGEEQHFLDPDETVAADANTRIRSIWPFIVSRVSEFQKTLSRRERLNFDHEDTIADVVKALLERNDDWDPARGKYITYAGTVIKHELYAIRDRAKTVESPRNATNRIKEYQAEEDEGNITARRLKTANDIRRTQRDAYQIIDTGFSGGGATEITIEDDDLSQTEIAEITQENTTLVKSVIQQLAPREAFVIGRVFGLWNHPEMSLTLLSWETQADIDELRKLKSSGMAKIRRILGVARIAS